MDFTNDVSAICVRMVFLLSPFMAIAIFAQYAQNYNFKERLILSTKISLTGFIICLVFLFQGSAILSFLGISLDSFKIGAGSLLFLTAISLIRGDDMGIDDEDSSFIYVPFAFPTLVGPGTLSFIILMGDRVHSYNTSFLPSILGIICAFLTIFICFIISQSITKLIGIKGIGSLSKVTGFILISIASQVLFSGIKSLLTGITVNIQGH